MATVTSIASGNWNADAATVWDTGSAPGASDDAVIASGHTVTVDAATSVGAVTVQSGGTLAIATYKLTTSGIFDNQTGGTVTGGVGGELAVAVNMPATAAGSWSLVGASGSPFVISGTASTRIYFYGGGTSSGGGSFQASWLQLKIHARVYNYYFTFADYYKDLDLEAVTDFGWVGSTSECVIYRLTADDAGVARIFRNGLKETRYHLYDAVIGSNVPVFARDGGDIEMHNCIVDCPVFVDRNTPYPFVIRSVGHQGVEGAWLQATYGGDVQRSADAKKAGVYGIEMVPASTCAPEWPTYFEVSIPVASGQAVAPSFYYKNVDADLDLEAAADRFVAVLDPGDEWGLHEEVDVNGASDSYTNWRQVAFTGGTVGGTGAKGLLVIRIYLKRYVSGASVYVADPAD